MSRTLGTLARSDIGRSPSQVGITPPALRILDRLRAEAGDVVLIVAPGLSDEILCVGLRDVVLGPHDVLIATVHGCPIYVDRRTPELAGVPAMVLDVERDIAGWRFVLQPPTESVRS